MDRRRFVGDVTKALGAVGAVGALPRKAFASSDEITLAAAGDCILTRKVSRRRDDRFLELVNLIRKADCAWANCEMTFMEPSKGYPGPKGGDMNLICEPWGAEELAWMGFDVVGCANNHSKDYGNEGVLENIHNLQGAGIAWAGTGANLEEASRPRYVDTPGGRVGQVNCASTFPSWSLAAHSTPYSRGRPGLNPLRVQRTYRLDEESFGRLKQLDGTLREIAGRSARREGAPEDELTFLRTDFVSGYPPDVLAVSDPRDLERITDAVAIARRNARLVIATIHAHESYKDREVPGAHLQPFARACIDAGADAFIGTGPHLLRGVEIYNGKPIFYSIGNFFFQYETVKQIPAEVFEANQLHRETLDPSLSYDKFSFPEDHVYWESVVPLIIFRGESVEEIQLHPVTLGQNETRHERGTPVLATREEAEAIVSRVAKLSEAFGTGVQYRDGIGYVSLPAKAPG